MVVICFYYVLIRYISRQGRGLIIHAFPTFPIHTSKLLEVSVDESLFFLFISIFF